MRLLLRFAALHPAVIADRVLPYLVHSLHLSPLLLADSVALPTQRLGAGPLRGGARDHGDSRVLAYRTRGTIASLHLLRLSTIHRESRTID